MATTQLFTQLLSEWQVRLRTLDTGIPRRVLPSVLLFVDSPEAIVISGVRRCGKTWLCYQVARYLIQERGIPLTNLHYLNFEDERLFGGSAVDLNNMLEAALKMAQPGCRLYLFLDEIQEVPAWERWVNRMVEQSPEIKIFVTGSNAHLLSSEFATLLSGRNITITMHPFDFGEFLQFHGVSLDPATDPHTPHGKARSSLWLERFIEWGGFPAAQSSADRSVLLRQYIHDILYRDVITRYEIRDVRSLESLALYFLTHACQRSTSQRLAGILGLSRTTVDEYSDYLAKANLVFTSDYFSFKIGERTRRPRKIYAIDTGIARSLGLDFSPNFGHYTENAVACELLRRGQRIQWWEDMNEVDFVASAGSVNQAINVSVGDTVPDREFKGFASLKEQCGHITGFTLLTRDVFGENEGVRMLPVWVWLLHRE